MSPETTKRYRLAGDNFDMTVEIDHAVMTEEKLHEINNFWGAADQRVADRGNVLHAVLAMLFNQVQALAARRFDWGVSLGSVLYTFGRKDENGRAKDGQEGWPEMDGTEGIRIAWVAEELSIDEEPRIKEVKA